jgi:hypothetical protein
MALPTNAHRLVALPFGASIMMFFIALFARSAILGALACALFGGAGAVLSMLDIRFMLKSGKGVGRLSAHVCSQQHPASFKLHIAALSLICCIQLIVLVWSVEAIGEMVW